MTTLRLLQTSEKHDHAFVAKRFWEQAALQAERDAAEYRKRGWTQFADLSEREAVFAREHAGKYGEML